MTIHEPQIELLPRAVFNTLKSDYTHPSLFLGEAPGLFDTVNKQYPTIWKLYKGMKSLDWDENEFDYTSCNAEFKTLPQSKVQKMIKSLAWQWEADSVASRSVAHIVSLFDPCPELWAAWQQISCNEVVHAATYSEIVRLSFDNPKEVLGNILAITEAIQRIGPLAREMAWIRERGLKFQLGLVPNDQETYNAIFMFAFVMLCLERIQFMSSFAVTFALGQEGLFMPICKAVQRICQDEYEVHVDLDKEVLANELKTPRGQLAYQQLKPRMTEVLNAVIKAELTWNPYLFEEGEDLRYLNKDSLDKWVLFSATNVARPLKLEMNFPQVEENPLPYMKDWCDIGNTQSSPMEEQKGDYRVNIMRRNDEDVEFAADF